MSPHPVDIHVGQRLRLRRTIMGMSQDSLGTAVGVTFQQVQKYERGLNRIGSSRLFEFSRILNVPVGYFFEDYQDPKLPSNADYPTASSRHIGMAHMAEERNSFEHERIMNKEVMNLVRAYSDIKNPLVRKRVLALVKSLSQMDALMEGEEEDLSIAAEAKGDGYQY